MNAFKVHRLAKPISAAMLGQQEHTWHGVTVSGLVMSQLQRIGSSLGLTYGNHSMLRADVVVDKQGVCHVVEVNSHELGGGCWYEIIEDSLGVKRWWNSHAQLLRQQAERGRSYVIAPWGENDIVDFVAYGLNIPVLTLEQALESKQDKLLLYFVDDDLRQLDRQLLLSVDQVKAIENKANLLNRDLPLTVWVPETVDPTTVVERDQYIYKAISGWGGTEVTRDYPADPTGWIAQRLIDDYVCDDWHAVFGCWINGAPWVKLNRNQIVGAKAGGSVWAPVLGVD